MLMTLIKYFSVIALLGMFTVLIIATCDIYEEKDYAISALDRQGCALLQDSVTVDVATVDLSTFNPGWNNMTVFQNVPQIIDSLMADSIFMNMAETSYKVSTPGALDTTYIALETSLTSVVLFMNDFLQINVIGTDGTILEKADETIDPATVFYTSLTEPENWEVNCSTMKNRVVYNFDETQKLIQIVKTDQSTKHEYRFVFLSNQ